MARIEKVKGVLNRVLSRVCLDKDKEQEIYSHTNEFILDLKKVLTKHKIKADIFLGGSVAKKTLIKKSEYDIDVFLRFPEKDTDENLNKAISKIKEINGIKPRTVKGSRNYLQFRKNKEVFEVIPTTKISKPTKARNVTDLSYFHVNYVEKCVKKNKKLGNEIKLAKAFVYGSGCYGAESYIKGFSGYAVELLACYYKSFMGFVRAIATSKDKIVLDPSRFYKNKNQVLENMNESKLFSPMILVDPTFKERNALAALSQETFDKFKDYCKKFLKKPNMEFFELKEIDLGKLKNKARKKKMDFVKIIARTDKQEGDIAGSKLLKFFNYLVRQLERYFDLETNEFEYPGEQIARYYFVIKPKKTILHVGPPLDKRVGVEAFKKKHKKTAIKKGRIYAEEKLDITLDKFLKKFQKDDKKVMLDMGITKIELV